MPATDPEPGPHYNALIQLLRTAGDLWDASRVFFDRWDLSPSQFNILNRLDDAPAGLTQTELSRRLVVHRSNVTGLIDRLEKRGLVRRRNRPEDRRVHHVHLTPAGSRLLRRVRPHFYKTAETIWNGVPKRRAKRNMYDELFNVPPDISATA
jgi:DNA-binding MarR family transcriptional regulator